MTPATPPGASGFSPEDLPLAVRPRLVASDLDGTLLPPDLQVAPALVPAIDELQRAGVTFVVCTGRMVKSAAVVAAGLGAADGLAVCYSGGVVVDLASGDWLVHLPLERTAAIDVIGHARRLGRHLNVYVDDDLFVEEADHWARWTSSYAGVELHVVGDLLELVDGRRPTKIVLATEPDDALRLLPALRERWSGVLNVSRSQPHFIEINDRRASKSGALEWLQSGLQAAGPTVAVGDGLNDLDMLRWADLGVAVAEGDEEVRAAADLVVPRAALPAVFERLARLPG